MTSPGFDMVTGAFSYTGRYIATKLLSLGREVRTLTGHPGNVSPIGGSVSAFPLRFDAPDELAASLRGATTLYNTYWIRFPRGKLNFDVAVNNTKILIKAAQQAGVRQIVHVSITNASPDSPLPYFKGKGFAEGAVAESGLAYSIIRPTLVFGAEDILLNNIAWFLRKFPLFLLPGKGDYKVQPVYVEDLAEAAVDAGKECRNTVSDCVGPEVYPYAQLIRLVAEAVGVKAKILGVSPGLTQVFARMAGYLVRDVVLTRSEIDGLMAGLLVSESPPTGRVSLRGWLQEHGKELGARYASELRRHYR